ncbi:MAG: cyclase family protein [Acidimicrobiales bacterium]
MDSRPHAVGLREREELGPVGSRRRGGRAQPDHAGQAPGGCSGGDLRRGRQLFAATLGATGGRQPDFVGVAFHGMATSHIDALCHVFVDGRMYNGFDGAEVRSTGARRNSILGASDGIVSRGVLLDVPRSLGVDSLDKGHVIRLAELEACEAVQGVTVSAGDILLVATGRDARRAAEGPWNPFTGLPRLHPECIPWLHDRDIAVLGADGVNDPMPGLGIEGWFMPVHQCALAGMGVHLLDNLRLDRLAAACSANERWTFQFTVAPLHVEGGTGSPANPIAVL